MSSPSPVGTAGVAGPVLRSLYRQLLREANKIDSTPVAKVMFPLPRKLSSALGLSNQLYVPDSRKYCDLVRTAFRGTAQQQSSSADKSKDATSSSTAKFDLNLAFDTLNRLKKHSQVMEESLPKITKETSALTKAFEKVEEVIPSTKGQYVAKPVKTPLVKSSGAAGALEAGSQSEQPRLIASAPMSEQPQALSPGMILDLPASVESIFPSALMKRDPTAIIKPGLGLIAHPLSSAHVDRRVMIITEKTNHLTSGLVLDMAYNYPLSYGNPMFPEVMWGHEVMNGGYCHVDFTMPPTANVSILHTLPPPSRSTKGSAGGGSGSFFGVGNTDSSRGTTTAFDRWFSWAKEMKMDTSTPPEEHHALLCKPLIQGNPENPLQEPTLYYSKVEALPYLATLCPGQPKDSLRVYWGCMKWNTNQLAAEIESGHWIPIELSPHFFSAYSVRAAFDPPKSRGGAAAAGSGVKTASQTASEAAYRPRRPIPPSEIKKDIDLSPSSSSTTNEASEDGKSGTDKSSDEERVATERETKQEKGEEEKPVAADVVITSEASDSLSPAEIAYQRDTSEHGGRFPTTDELREAKERREKILGVDVAQPQVFPPDQPLCRREALWDQILFSMGGEFRDLVGCANPFSQAQQQGLQVGGVGKSNSPLPKEMMLRLLAELQRRDSDDDDDDDDE